MFDTTLFILLGLAALGFIIRESAIRKKEKSLKFIFI